MTKIRAIANLCVGLVCLLHVGFLVLEMFFWDKPLGLCLFDLKPQIATDSKFLAMNLGLYNGFLAAGLAWGLRLAAKGNTQGTNVKVFFLVCALLAGLFGAVTANPNILFAQALPAVLALALVYLSETKG